VGDAAGVDMKTLIECEQLSKSFGSTVALDSLDLTVQAGAPVALVGPNGAGKTTLLGLLCGFIHPTKGSARILGHKPGSWELIGRITALPQDAEFDPNFNVGKQVQFLARLQGMSASAAKQDAKRVLDLVQLGDSWDSKAGALSHGMRKRVALAQSLLGKPELVLLDEPTAGIDPPNVKIIRDLVRSLSSETTFFISSHNLDELEKLCESVVYLNDGKLAQTSSIDSDTDSGYLTINVPSVPEAEFIQACEALDGIIDVQRLAQGNFLIQCEPDKPVDQAILELIRNRQWSYRHLINGRSLEDRLYGN
jgi:ABC-type multidrug transport system ATPase subunit